MLALKQGIMSILSGSGGPGVGAHRYWKLNITANDGSALYMGLTELQLFDTSGVNRTAGSSGTLWVSSSGEINASNQHVNAVDGNLVDSGWLSAVAASPQFISFDTQLAGAPVPVGPYEVSKIRIYGSHNVPSASPRDFQLQWSDNGTDWTTVLSVTGQSGWAANEMREFFVPSPSSVGDPYYDSVVSLLNLEGGNGSTSIVDAKGKTWTTFGNAQISTAQAPFGTSSLSFDGSGDRVTTPSTVDFDFGSGDFTVECFVRVSALTDQVFFGRRNGAGFSPFGLGIFASKLQMLVSTSGSSWASTVADPVNFVANTWTHVALTRTGNIFTIWKNGASVATATVSGAVFTSTDALTVGEWGVGLFPVNGFIKGFRVTKGVSRYGNTFTPPSTLFSENLGFNSFTNVASLLRFEGADGSTSIVDQRGKAWTSSGAASARISTTGQSFGTGCLLLTNGTISSPDSVDWHFGAGDFTIQAWVTPANTSQIGAIVAQWDGSSGRSFVVYQVSGALQFSYSTDGSNSTNAFSTAVAWSTSTPQHIAISCVAGVVRGFFNGVQVGANHTLLAGLANSVRPITVGNEGSGTNQFNGRIDELEIIKGVGLYSSNFTPPTAASVDPGAIAIVPQCFDASVFSTPTVLSSANRRVTALSTRAGSYANARSLRPLRGLAYLSLEAQTDALGSVLGVGVCDAALDLSSASNYVGISTGSVALWLPSGNVFVNGSSIGNAGTGPNLTTVEIAVRVGSRRVWIRRSGGSWVGGGDPVADTSPTATLAGTGNIFAAASLSPASATAGRYAELDVDAESTAGAVPAGFVPANWF